MEQVIYLYIKDSKIKSVQKKRRERKLLRLVACDYKIRLIGKSHIKERQKHWILNRISDIFLKNKNHYTATSIKDLIIEKYKNRQNKLKLKS